MRTVASFAVFLTCGCGAATGIPVGESTHDASARDTSVLGDVMTPPPDAGNDATDADALPPPMDAEADVSGETVLCTWGGVGGMPISEDNCPAGSKCIPEQGCVPSTTPGPATRACGAISCATVCGCLSESVCNCANLP
jgi:hypothetical protein